LGVGKASATLLDATSASTSNTFGGPIGGVNSGITICYLRMFCLDGKLTLRFRITLRRIQCLQSWQPPRTR
jgi:hypothetical protein